MKNKNIKELLLIAEEMDKRSLFTESDIICKLAADIIDFEERASELRARRNQGIAEESEEVREGKPPEPIDFTKALMEKEQDQERVSVVNFIIQNLHPEVELDSDGLSYELRDILENNSEELYSYMMEVIPDKLSDLARDTNISSKEELLELITVIAMDMESYKDDDFKFLLKAMLFYMKDYELDMQG